MPLRREVSSARAGHLLLFETHSGIRPDPRGSFVLVMNDARNSEIEVSERQGRALRTRIPGFDLRFQPVVNSHGAPSL